VFHSLFTLFNDEIGGKTSGACYIDMKDGSSHAIVIHRDQHLAGTGIRHACPNIQQAAFDQSGSMVADGTVRRSMRQLGLAHDVQAKSGQTITNAVYAERR
jgi:hypothetical protein